MAAADMLDQALVDTPVVVGLDLSLTGTGYAGPDGTTLIRSAGHRGDTLQARQRRLDTLANQITDAVMGGPTHPDLVAIEAPSLGQGRQAGVHDRSGLWWLVVQILIETAGLNVVEVPPATLKKWLTGKGNATKSDMRMAVFKRFDADIADDNEVDAFALRALGLHALGHPLAPMPADRVAVLQKLALPPGWEVAS